MKTTDSQIPVAQQTPSPRKNWILSLEKKKKIYSNYSKGWLLETYN